MFSRKLRKFLRKELEGIPVALGLPVWRHCGAHRMDKSVEVCSIYILLLVPVGCGKDYIRIHWSRIHPHIQVNNKVELAKRRFPVLHLLEMRLCYLFAVHIMVRTKEELQEIFLPPCAGAKGVSAPYHPYPGPVLRRIRVINGKLESAALELFYRIIHYLSIRLCPGPLGILCHNKRALVKLGIPWKTPQSYCPYLPVSAMLIIQGGFIRYDMVFRYLVVILPLLGMDIPITRRILEPRRPLPVETKGYLAP